MPRETFADEPASEFLVVGIGASAGGLEAIRQLLQNVPARTSMAFVVVQHLDPTQESMLAELLGRHTALAVSQVDDDVVIERGHVYVIPPDTFLELKGNHLRLLPPTQRRGMRMAIDHLFRSLAQARRNLAVGIVLSGTGSDGTSGLRKIRSEGGLTLVQAPDTAAHHGMPQSAIDAGVADKVLPIEKMFEALESYARHPYSSRLQSGQTAQGDVPAEKFGKVAEILKAREKFPLDHYRDATVRRRVARRMGLTGRHDLDEYIVLLEESEEERQELLRDLLIGVTDFFRDAEAWEELRKEVATKIIEAAEPGASLRIWVPGCATGEEAYTVAITFFEVMEQWKSTVELTVFATDVDEDAIQFARTGLYPEGIQEHVPAELLGKYFTRESDDHYRVNGRLRDALSFAVQNLTSDPPFSRIDLITCRNVLIYLRREVQEKVMQIFHFALRPGGYLFLGSSESLTGSRALFSDVARRSKIFRRLDVEPDLRRSITSRLFGEGKARRRERASDEERPSRSVIARQVLLEHCLPPSVLIDGSDQIVYLHGDPAPFLSLPIGEPRLELLRLLPDDLRPRLRAALFKCRREKCPATVEAQIGEGEAAQRARIVVRRAETPEFGEGSLTITFEKLEAKREDPDLEVPPGSGNFITQLENELQDTRDDLQSTVEELESSNEALQSSHEEALSMNEEFQSANEELEATSEELRALNEELMTVNAELKEKITQLQQANEDINNFFSSTNIATVFLDAETRLERLTPASSELLGLTARDLDRPIGAVPGILVRDLANKAATVLRELTPEEDEIQTEDGRWFIRRVLPYRTEDRRIEGTVVTFNNVTRMQRTTSRLEARERQQHAAAELGLQALSLDSLDELLDVSVRMLAQTLEVEMCKVLEYVPDDHEFILRAGVGWGEGMVGDTRVPSGHDSQAGYTLSSRQPVIVEDLRTEKRFRGPAMLRKAGVVSGMSCIIADTRGQAFGVLGVHTSSKRIFTGDDTNFLVTVANILAMAIDRHRSQEAQAENEYRLRLATEAGGMGIWHWNVRTGAVAWSDREFALLGLNPREKADVENFFSRVHPDDVGGLRSYLQEMAESGGDFEAEFRVCLPDGSVRWLAGRGGAVLGSDGLVQSLIGVNYDISDQKLTQEVLTEADRRKNEFLAVLSHELRNPLSAISASLSLLSGADPKEAAWAGSVIRRQVAHLSRLIDDLLDISRITQGKIEMRWSRANVADLIRNAVSAVQPQFQALGHEVEVSIEPENIEIVADTSRIEQVLVNLLNNACKFIEGSGRISVIARAEGEEAVITVADNGVGIDPDHLRSIFELFTQVETQQSNGNIGAGIGLALAKNLVELHGGTIKASSEGKDRGSSFTVRLRRAPAEVPAKPSPPSSDGKKEHRPRRILVVDDNRDSAQALARLLRRKGHEVEVEFDGHEVPRIAAKFSPEVVLLDLGMPGKDGFSVARELRRKYPPRQMMIVAATGFGHEEYIRRTGEAGFDHHLVKPIDLEALYTLLNNFESESTPSGLMG